VTSALIGASSTEQLDHNLAALQAPHFTDEKLALIDQHGVHGTAARQ
jgi:L-glyceraldehyde 3-phosphate reductase